MSDQGGGKSSFTTIGAVLGIISTLLTIITQLGGFGHFRIPGLPGKSVEAELSISQGSGPSGTAITLKGSGFEAGETIEIRFHTDLMASAMGEDDGTFEVGARIPGSFDAFAPQQFEIIATGRSSARSARVPFHLTQANDPPDRPGSPELSVSKGSGPSGTQITLKGSGFEAGGTADIRFHTELIATARVDDDGTFEVEARNRGRSLRER